jgi:hypothetical protein
MLRRVLAAAVAAAGALLAATGTAQAAPAGYTLSAYRAMPGGYTLMVQSDTNIRLAAATWGVAAELRGLGATIRQQRGGHYVPGVIHVREVHCPVRYPSQAADTSTALGVMQAHGVALHGIAMMANIHVCDFIVNGPGAQLRFVLEHELGHALGLGHYRGTAAGRVQIMYPSIVHVVGYGAGDRAGLRVLISRSRV